MELKLKYTDNPMFDSEFLSQLFSAHERELYAKIVALNMDEEPIEEIQGRVTSGSVPVDGSSIVRRTCSLTLVANELNINDYVWGIKTKIRLFIGLKNKIDLKYPDIIWFKMGTFILTSFSSSISASGYTVSIQGKDKMCLLNGDIGGNLTALSYDFGAVDVINKNGFTYSEKLPLKKIISKAVHDFAKEPYHNIVINDLDECGLELLEYRGPTPLYFIYNPNTLEVSNMVLNTNQKYFLKDKKEYSIATMEEINDSLEKQNKAPQFVFKTLTGDAVFNEQLLTPTEFYGDSTLNLGPYNIIKIEKGMTCGYRSTELVYAGQLTSAVGDTITTMLSKIVSMLGNFEYFYNADGQFVFQKKRTYINTSWNNMINNGEEDWVENAAYTSSYIFSFEDGNLITSYQNSPNLANLRNDFSIWGAKTTSSGASVPIHLRYAIDEKPLYYTSLDGTTYTTRNKEEVEFDQKNFQQGLYKKYEKEPSKYGLSEDWWEVRDWAKAWEFSGLPVPTEMLRVYCPIFAKITFNKELDGQQLSSDLYYSYVSNESYYHNSNISGITTDDLVFMNNRYQRYHGSCAHTYTWWLDAFKPGGIYEGGEAYFYKPMVPATDDCPSIEIGTNIKYSLDWRELIYRMAEDFNKHGDEDDFLANVREKNSFFYPTGYTGYEQYYVDISGFWRQLYDPEYTASYDIISLTKKQYEDEARFHTETDEDPWYYDMPVYRQCDEDEIFYSSINYYIKNKEEYSLVEITKRDLEKNPTNYYVMSGTEVKPLPLSVAYFNEGGEYYKRAENGYIKVLNPVKDDIINYYTRDAHRSYFPCMKIEAFVNGRLYFIQYEDNGSIQYKPITGLKENIYLSNPGDYFKRVIKGGQILFENCTIIQPFDKEREYYLDGTEKAYTKEEYEKLGYNNKLQYAVITYTYTPVIHPKLSYDEKATYYKKGLQEYYLDLKDPNLYWNKKVNDSPEALNFWFDFLDSYGDLSEYSVHNVGDRPKAVNDNNVKAIYFRETPGVIFVENLKDLPQNERKSGYTYAQLPSYLEYLFTISGQGKSAKDVLDEYLYNYSYCTESITISALPIYSLEPNTRIFVRDDKSGINGEYIISKISFPLDANGTMSINATKVVDRIY